MSYLARLKAEIAGKRLPSEPTKPTKAPSVSFVSAQGSHISEIPPRTPTPDADADAMPDPAAEARRREVLAMLAANPTARFALLTDTEADPEAVILALAIRGRVTCELRIPRARYDPFLLLTLIQRHSRTVH